MWNSQRIKIAMTGKLLSAEEHMLLQLMDKYKPHLKPYAYRQDTWLRVLEDYNEKTGNLYRQPRTLKAKFNKMRASYSDEEFAKNAPEDFELWQKLVDETEGATIGRPSRKRARSSFSEEESQQEGLNNDNPGLDGDSNDEEVATGGIMDQEALDLEDNNDVLQPPPLDSITMGFSTQKSPATSNLSLDLKNEGSPPTVDEKPHSNSTDQPKPLLVSRKTHNAHFYEHLTASLLELLKRKSDLPNTVANHGGVTLDQIYSEIKESQRSEQQFREQVLLRLDTIIERLDNQKT